MIKEVGRSKNCDDQRSVMIKDQRSVMIKEAGRSNKWDDQRSWMIKEVG